MEWKQFWNQGPPVRASDSCRQVARTLAGKPYSAGVIDNLVARLLSLLRGSREKTLLDLCCGNGMITCRLADHFGHVTAVDYSEPLLAIAQREFSRENIAYLPGDATDLAFVYDRYDCVLVNFSLQYFSPHQARSMFAHLDRIVKPGGRIVLGDVADGDRKWSFYRGPRGRARYAFELLRRKPTIGHWWRPAALREIAHARGWTLSIYYQPPQLPNHYFRYDAVLRVPADRADVPHRIE